MKHKKLLSGMPACMAFLLVTAVPLSASAEIVPNWQPDQWYDVDGDGIFEFISNNHFYTNPLSPRVLFDRPGYSNYKPNTVQMGKLPGENVVIYKEPSKAPGIISNGTFKRLDVPSTFTLYSRDVDYSYIADYSNSGRKGLVRSDGNALTGRTYKIDASGNYTPDRYDIYSWNEYYDIRSDLTLSSGGDGIPGMDDMFGYDGGGSTITGFTTVDINGDGIPDLLDGSNGGYYLNTGLGGFVKSGFGGTTELRDLNNDGIIDFVIYDRSQKIVTVSLTRPNNTPYTKELLKGYTIGDQIFCHDFDRDGDIDVLVPVVQDNGAFLIYYQNDGQGNFKQYENWLDGSMIITLCHDIDSDGYYEILALGKEATTSALELRVYRVSGATVDDTYTTIPIDMSKWTYDSYNIRVINVDHSGIPYLAVSRSYEGEQLIKLDMPANKRPKAPTQISYTHMPASNMLKVYWTAGSDNETPEADLTYEIKVGTAPGLDDIVSANALSDGRRRNQLQGSNGYLRYRTFDISSWPKGKCYITVQTVDDGKLGSTFCEPAIFEKGSYPVSFSIDGPDTYAIGDVLTLIANEPNPAANYKWNAADAQVLETAGDKSAIKIRLTSAGKKTLTLSCGGGESFVRYIDVLPAKFTNVDETILKEQLSSITSTFDLDADGSEEYIAESKFYEQKADGSINAINKLYNNNLALGGTIYPIDLNRDGLLDLLSSGSTYRIVANNGDKNLSISDKHEVYYNGNKLYGGMMPADFDNDGALEAIFRDSYYYYAELEDLKEGIAFKSVKRLDDGAVEDVLDFNFDGLPDILYSKNQVRGIYLNDGNGNFTFDSELPKIGKSYPVMYGDFDGDHTIDYVYNSASYAFGVSTYASSIVIKYGNGRTVEAECPADAAFSSIYRCADYTNNGMKDFVVSLADTNKHAIIFINRNYSYEVRVVNIPGTTFPLHTNDGKMYYGSNLLSDVTNTAPSKPSGLSASVSGAYLNIEWADATDNETHSGSLRYNISVKHKGMQGEGAYLLSPMNLERDNVSVPTNHRLLSAPRIKIPLASIPAGDYEVRVQAVDGMYLTSAFSDILTVSVTESALMECPASTYVNIPITAILLGNIDAASVDFGTDAEVSGNGKSRTVVWSSAGTKSITANGKVLATVLVKPRPEVDFTLPSSILAGATVKVDCPTASQGTWDIVNGSVTTPLHESKCVENIIINDCSLTFTVTTNNEITLRHTIEDTQANVSCTQTSSIDDVNCCPELKKVTVGEHNEIQWHTSSLPDNAMSVNVYRETSRLNVYELIGNESVSSEYFVDLQSNPAIKADRYRISAVLPYGESAPSEAHQPIHLRLNKGVNDAINMMWSKYEGLDVDTYTIYTGDSAENMIAVDQISGNKTSYTLAEPKAYCAVGVTLGATSRVATDESIFSNIACTADATNALIATSIEIVPTQGSNIVDLATTSMLQLKAVLAPAGISFSQVDWEVVSGQDIASVDNSGLVKATAAGNIEVKATTRDGSNLSATIQLTAKRIEVPLTWLEFTTWPKNHALETGQTFQYIIKTEPANTTERPIWESTNPNVATVTQDGLVTAIRQGTTDIYVRSTLDPDMFINLSLTVTGNDPNMVYIQSIELVPNTIASIPNTQIQVEAIINPENATDKTLTWEIYPYDSPVAKVSSDGLVTIMEEGEATLIVWAMDGSDVYAMAPIPILSSIDGIFADKDATVDVYTTTGILTKHNASIHDIRELTPGLYVINGKVVLLR